VDDSFLLMFNAHDAPLDFTLPPPDYAAAWRIVIDTNGLPESTAVVPAGGTVTVVDKAMVVLEAVAAVEEQKGPGDIPAATVPSIPPTPVSTNQAAGTKPVATGADDS
jgi:hypothetical protein